ncbi:MAG: hypothetical protein IT378_03300 [Sandaracinaceae bacterium]|nr:hypothetical protein [Sandaracinaceae bacterium]
MNEVPCRRCGDFIDPSAALYSEAGELVCATCNVKAEIAGGEERAARAIFAASGTSVLLGLAAGFLVNPCFITSVLGVLSAIGTFVLLYRHPEHRARLGWKLPVTIGAAVLGIVLCLAAPFVRIAMLLLTGYPGLL